MTSGTHDARSDDRHNEAVAEEAAWCGIGGTAEVGIATELMCGEEVVGSTES
jgi:hypothetical protein